MRTLQIILLIIFTNYMVVTGQNMSKIEDKLRQEIMQHKRNENLRINIILNEQYNQAEMQNKTQFIKNNEEKRSFVVNELKEFSKVTQRNIIMRIKG